MFAGLNVTCGITVISGLDIAIDIVTAKNF